jgi:hypothetical protein
MKLASQITELISCLGYLFRYQLRMIIAVECLAALICIWKFPESDLSPGQSILTQVSQGFHNPPSPRQIAWVLLQFKQKLLPNKSIGLITDVHTFTAYPTV